MSDGITDIENDYYNNKETQEWMNAPLGKPEQIQKGQHETQVSGILADFENLLIDIMCSRKCSIGSLENYYDLRLEVKRINELYSKIQSVSQNSR